MENNNLKNWVLGSSRAAVETRIRDLQNKLHHEQGLPLEEADVLSLLHRYLPLKDHELKRGRRAPASNDVLKETVRSFINWRNAKKEWRSRYTTRLQKHIVPGFYRVPGRPGELCATEWPFRDCGDCDNIAPRSINHTGWYCTINDQETIRGRVLQLPAKKGQSRFIAGTYSSDFGGITIYIDRIFDEKIDAALYADSCARQEAEKARNADIDYTAQSEIETKKEEIKETRNAMKALIRELKALKHYQLLSVQPYLPFMGEEVPTALCQTFPLLISNAVSKLRELSKEKSEAAQRILRLTSDPFLVLE